MEHTFGSEFLVGRWHVLSSGLRVRLRLAQSRDARPIEALLAASGLQVEALEVVRLLRADPRERVSVCATALVGSEERLVGFGTMLCTADEPQLVCAHPELADGLQNLVRQALLARTHRARARGSRAGGRRAGSAPGDTLRRGATRRGAHVGQPGHG